MTKDEIIEMARQAGFVDYELDDGTTNSFDKRYEVFAKLVAEKAIKEALAQPDQEPVAWEQFYPDIGKPQIEQPKVRTGDCLLVGVCASEGHKIQKAQPEQDSTYTYASSLATAIWQKHYMKESPKFALLDTTEGVLTQIDNMTCGLVREKPAQPEQEPVAWMDEYGDVLSASVVSGKGLRNIPLYTTPPQRTERPVDCERCNRLEEQAYDLVGKLRVANIKLSMQPQRTWVDLTEAEIDEICLGDEAKVRTALKLIKEKNNG